MIAQFHVRAPATSANLGPGFDTLGLALHNELTLGECDRMMVSIDAEGAGELAADGDNLRRAHIRGRLGDPPRAGAAGTRQRP
jgi:homoserine kinase